MKSCAAKLKLVNFILNIFVEPFYRGLFVCVVIAGKWWKHIKMYLMTKHQYTLHYKTLNKYLIFKKPLQNIDCCFNTDDTYIHNHVDAHVRHVPEEEMIDKWTWNWKYEPDDASLLWRDLRVLDQLRQVLLADPVLRLDVQQDDPGWRLISILVTLIFLKIQHCSSCNILAEQDFPSNLCFKPDLVVDGDVLVEEDWHNVPHVVADLLSWETTKIQNSKKEKG